MNIKFIEAERKSEFSVAVTYSLNDEEFTVEWSNIHEETGEIGCYDLSVNVDSFDGELANRVSEAIKKGESDSNADENLYLFIRDTFNSNDCADFEG